MSPVPESPDDRRPHPRRPRPRPRRQAGAARTRSTWTTAPTSSPHGSATEMKAAGMTHALGMGRLDGPGRRPARDQRHAPARRAGPRPPRHRRRRPDQDPGGRPRALQARPRPTSPPARSSRSRRTPATSTSAPTARRTGPYIRLAARYKIPFVFHTGDTWSTRAKLRFAHPLLVDDVAVEHPDVKFVHRPLRQPLADRRRRGHLQERQRLGRPLGHPRRQRRRLRAPTTTASPPRDSHWALILPDLRKAFRYADKPDRFLYGTDWPLAPMASYRAFVESFIPKEHHQAVFDDQRPSAFPDPMMRLAGWPVEAGSVTIPAGD